MTRILSYYGDDFTGSTDVMEALATHGIETVLFTRIPTAEEFAPFAGCAAAGLAGTSRSESPEWMSQNLPAALVWLKTLEARFCHYKVCSTFDSSPAIGNIGRAAEIGAAVFEQAVVPMVVGAPQLKRFTFAGNLFAAYQDKVFRIDRHPVMSRHPVTPMAEADLRLHLAQQTTLPVNLMQGSWPSAGVVMIDVHDRQSQRDAGDLLLGLPAGAAPFVVGSSGVEYALVHGLAARGVISGHQSFAPLDRVEQVIAVSGSVSPTTERQINHALAAGFDAVPVSATALARGDESEIGRAVASAIGILSGGRSPLVYSALGSATDCSGDIADVRGGRANIGRGLGRVLREVLSRTSLRRAIVAGGDSSSHALSQLDVHALTTRYPLPATPGSPLCRAFSSVERFNGLEIAMKGGQVGGSDYFVQLRDGGA